MSRNNMRYTLYEALKTIKTNKVLNCFLLIKTDQRKRKFKMRENNPLDNSPNSSLTAVSIL